MKAISILILITINFLAFGSDLKLEEKKIEYLLYKIETSNAKFERNGEKHSAKKAVSHLKFKLIRAKGLFSFLSGNKITAKAFIDNIASKSSTTDKIYYMILPDGKKVTTKSWLDKQLKSFKLPK